MDLGVPGRPCGQVAVSAADIMRPAPAPHRAREAAPARKAGGLRWFRLVVRAHSEGLDALFANELEKLLMSETFVEVFANEAATVYRRAG